MEDGETFEHCGGKIKKSGDRWKNLEIAVERSGDCETRR